MHQPAALQEGPEEALGVPVFDVLDLLRGFREAARLTGIEIAAIVAPTQRRRGFWQCVLMQLLAAALVAASWSVEAQDIGVGLIIPLSAPGDATGGQSIRRGAEIGIEMINAQGGVLGKKMQLFVQDSQGKPEAGVAAYRRLVSENKVVAVPGFFSIPRSPGSRSTRSPRIWACRPSRCRRRRCRHHRQALRHRLPHPPLKPPPGRLLDPPTQPHQIKGYKCWSLIAETTDYGIGLAD